MRCPRQPSSWPPRLGSEILRSQEALVTAAAARAAELEKSVMSIDPVQAEAVLGDLFALRHDL
jgi:hypothetical protein